MRIPTYSLLLAFFHSDEIYAGYLAKLNNYLQKILVKVNGSLSSWIPKSFRTIFFVKLLVFILISLFVLPVAWAQNPVNGQRTDSMTTATLPTLLNGKGRIIGVVLDESGRKPVAFATVILVDKSTGKMINGTISEENGKFFLSRIAKGQYQLSATFMGYETHVIPNLVIQKGEVNIGTIALRAIPEALGEVAVMSEKTLVEDKLEPLVYNADKD